MHQDQRIGLALAVLLIGAAGAFFFRNDPRSASSSPRLKSARELDARIAEKSTSPYMQNADEDHETRGTTARTVSDRGAAREGRLPRLRAPDFDDDFSDPSDHTDRNSSTADNRTIQELAPIPFPETGDDASQADRTPVAGAADSPVPAERIHVVQKGETLSSIAAKELGSSTRFLEVFEANRDQLDNANDVRVGMSLRIPARRTPRTTPPPSRENSTAAPPLLPTNTQSGELPVIGADPAGTSPARTSGDSPAPRKKFEPAHRPPLGVKGLGSQSSDAQPPSSRIRKLSQLPPGDAGGKVAR